MRVAYVRVSTAEQNEERQLEALEHFGIERWYTEKVSGKNTNRPKLQEMLDFVREGDVVYVHDLSRLARSTKDLLSIVEQLDAKGVQLVYKTREINKRQFAERLHISRPTLDKLLRKEGEKSDNQH